MEQNKYKCQVKNVYLCTEKGWIINYEYCIIRVMKEKILLLLLIHEKRD